MPEPEFNRVFFSLGSNIQPELNLPLAVRKLAERGRITAVSSVWETSPVGYLNQNSFLNAAVLLITQLSASVICNDLIPRIENELNRVRDPSNKNGPRTIDIDLTLFNSEVLKVNHHQIPDPDLLSRGFVAITVAELDPDFIHPIEMRKLKSIASEFDQDQLGMKLRKEINIKMFIHDES